MKNHAFNACESLFHLSFYRCLWASLRWPKCRAKLLFQWSFLGAEENPLGLIFGKRLRPKSLQNGSRRPPGTSPKAEPKTISFCAPFFASWATLGPIGRSLVAFLALCWASCAQLEAPENHSSPFMGPFWSLVALLGVDLGCFFDFSNLIFGTFYYVLNMILI